MKISNLISEINLLLYRYLISESKTIFKKLTSSEMLTMKNVKYIYTKIEKIISNANLLF